MEAAIHNWKIIEKYGGFRDALHAQQDTQLGYGSEFKKPELLKLIFGRHPLWERWSAILSNGAEYPLEHLDDSACRQDLIDGYEYGNHKGVNDNPDLFEGMMTDEIEHGWQLPIPREMVLALLEAMIAPMNISDQQGINERGEIIPKKRLTHNQSMEFSSGTSINGRMQHDQLQDLMYGTCLKRLIHDITLLRFQYPDCRILITKIDYKSAYRRATLNWKYALMTIIQIITTGIACIGLRLTFGGACNPSIWNNASESVTDLANAIMQCDDWDPDELHSPLQDTIPPAEENTDPRPFAKALPLCVNWKRDGKGKADVYIDDTITVYPELNSKDCRKAECAVLLALFTAARAVDKNDPIKRADITSISKLLAEARPEEHKIILGWKLDSRSLTISLPIEKFIAWTNIIDNIVQSGVSTANELESMIGRLGHVSTILPYSKHFMSRIRQAQERAKNRRSLKLNNEVIQDFIFHRNMLEKAHKGISFNLLTFRKVTHLYKSDACPFGMGGHSHRGRAWRFYIPAEFRFRMTINMLEHLASVIGPWIDIIENNLEEFSCVLSLTDSSTTEGWLRKSNFKYNNNESMEMTSVKLDISRGHAMRLMNNNCKDYSQWFPGDKNVIPDSLSRDSHLSDEQLTSLYLSKIPEQVPLNFKISPLPEEITSFIFSCLQKLPEQTQPLEKEAKSTIGTGIDGSDTCQISESTMTHSSTTSVDDKQPFSSQLSQKQLDAESFLIKEQILWSQKQSDPPWTAYLRPSENTTDPTQDLTETTSLANFYKNSIKATKRKTAQKNIRKQSH